jgi:exodeoxyribonuclease VII large subunit
MSIYQLRVPLEDGMKIVVRGVPKVTKWGKFSFTVSAIKPVGDGSIKKAFELLKKKLSDEGLFAPEKKRELPKDLTKLGVISSTGAAGYADFVKILNARWGGIHVQVAHTQVQGMDAPDQIIRALKYFNERSEVQVIAILRGGGSADDLSCFNDEELVRAIAA